jgi:peptide/nickel transport system ATP-binding protein
MYLGQIVELAPADELFSHPLHPYTKLLIEAGRWRAGDELDERDISNEVPSPTAPPPGCRFNTRCPHVMPRCRTELPRLRALASGHLVRCHEAESLTAFFQERIAS